MRSRSAFTALAFPAVCVLSLSLAGCAGDDGGSAHRPTAAAKPAEAPSTSPAPPRTPEEFLARAREAMSAQKGWTFTVKGSEGLTAQGRRSTATYTATVDRTQDPMALHSTGTTHAKGVAKPEEVYVLDGTGHVRKGGTGARWKSGPLTDPEIADVVEDPVLALDAFRSYARQDPAGAVSVRKSAGHIELRASAGPAALPAVRDRGVVKKAVRELTPTLEQLRAAGITTPEDRITVDTVEEVLTLDPITYRITAHSFRCALLIPYGGQELRYSQAVSERTQGVFTGTITLPTSVG